MTTLQNNPGITGSGSIALAGECWDAQGNKLPNNSIVLRIVNGAIATIAITQTTIAPGAGAVAFGGVAPTVQVNTIISIAPPVGAVAIAGVAPTVAVS